MEEEHTIGEKLLEAEKRLRDSLDRARELKEQEVGDGGEMGEDENPGSYFSNPKNPYVVDKRPEVVEETPTPHTILVAEGGEDIITEDDLEMTPSPLNACPKRIDLEDTFMLSEGDLEEDRTGRTAQDDRYWDLMVKRGEVENPIVEKWESWISPETRRLLASKAAALHANKSDLVVERGKALWQQLRRDRKKRIRKVSTEVEERLVAKDVIGAYTMLRPWYQSYDGKTSTPSEGLLRKSEAATPSCIQRMIWGAAQCLTLI